MLGYVATHGTNPAVRKVPYDAVKDFTPVAMVVGTPNVLVVGAGVPATDMKSLVEWSKKNKVSYGSSGQGSLTHLAMEQFRTAPASMPCMPPTAASARPSPTCWAARRR
jgi:tripartite-type tricarboxylate transporter receptor subunit TctC